MAAQGGTCNEPISTAGPTPTDERHSRELEVFLCDSGLYESNAEARLREEVRRRKC